MTHWILPSNPTNYDIRYDFDNYGNVDWYQNKSITNMQIGDYAYIYISTPVQEIKWKCVVQDVNYYLYEGNRQHFYNKHDNDLDGPFVQLVPLIEFDITDKLCFKELKNHGLKSRLMGPQKVSGSLLQYLKDIEDIQNDPNKYIKFIQSLPQDVLKKYALKNLKKKVKTTHASTKQFIRNQYVAQYYKLRAKGICQLCNIPAPFVDKNSKPYLESHHIVWLSKGGDDSVDNTVALCPNCHRKMHIINDKNDVDYLLKLIKKLEE